MQRTTIRRLSIRSVSPLSPAGHFLLINLGRLASVFAVGLLAFPLSTCGQESWNRISRYFSVPQKYSGQLGDYRSPLLFADGTRVMSPSDWKRRRAEILAQWEEQLGKWPALLVEQRLKVLSTRQQDVYSLSKVSFNWTPLEKTEGYLLVPSGKGPFPAVITVYYEPETAIGNGEPLRDFAVQLARRGFVTLSIGTTQATRDQTYAIYHPSLNQAEVQPLSMLGCAAANAWHALANHEQVDSKRIGIVGHSFGGKWALFASCLFERFSCAAWSDPGIVFDTRPSVNYWEPWYLGYHPKPWRPRGIVTAENPAQGLYPRLIREKRDLHELHALMAPRPFLVSGGSEDPESRWMALNHSVEVNRILGKKHRVGMTNRPQHVPTAESNEAIYDFFEHFLKSSQSNPTAKN